MPIFQLSKLVRKHNIKHLKEQRKEEFKKLLHLPYTKAKAEHFNSETQMYKRPKLQRVLESFHFYYDEIFKYNWNAMNNTWYQNHRDLALDTRKYNLEISRSEGSVQRELNSYQPQVGIVCL